MRWIPVQQYRCGECGIVVSVEGLSPDVCANCGAKADKNVLIIQADTVVKGDRGPIGYCTIKQGRKDMLRDWLTMIVQRTVGGEPQLRGSVRVATFRCDPESRTKVTLNFHGNGPENGDLLLVEIPE